MAEPPIATRRTYLGLFAVTMATLMYEILLTRIFSVTMWYHFSFVAISVAMFGMTAGALAVYLCPRWFATQHLHRRLTLTSLLFSLTIVGSFALHLHLRPDYSMTAGGVASVALFYVVISVPFFFGGICVCLALTRFTRQVGRLYAADLIGAAAGCVALVGVMSVCDGPSAVLAAAALGAAGAACFAASLPSRWPAWAIACCCVALVSGAVYNTRKAAVQDAPLALRWVKGQEETRWLYEKWNSFSRVTVTGDMTAPRSPFGWGLSPVCPQDPTVKFLWLTIDAGAGTVITKYDHQSGQLDHLKYDVVNLAHWIRPQSSVLVIGAGGGRDVLSALAFDQRHVTAVEINGAILNAVNGVYADWTGRLAQDKRITFVNDEARSYVARSGGSYDIIQISLIDTWAATAAGAFVLTENTLYTREAWTTFLQRLTPRGVLTVSRWYWKDKPGEVYRIVSLAVESLRAMGVKDPLRHIALARNMNPSGSDAQPDGVGTILVSPSAFSENDLAALGAVCDKMKFEIMLNPAAAAQDGVLAELAAGKDAAPVSDRLGLNVQAPTDDCPFFFHQLRLRDIWGRCEAAAMGVERINIRAVAVLGALLMAVIGLTLLCVIVPLLLTMRRVPLSGSGWLLVFFACIGMGFMLVEVSQMQRLIVFLGHPTYGLSVVLFALLLSAGVGSFLTRSCDAASGALRRLGILLAVLIVFGLLTPMAIAWFRSSPTPLRIVVAVAILSPLGLFMGMAFPLGMKLASRARGDLTAWLFGINGATSICASVAAMAVALAYGISASFWTGVVCYAVAFAAFGVAARRAARGS